MSDTIECKGWCGMLFDSDAVPVHGPCGKRRMHYGQPEFGKFGNDPVYCSQACWDKAKLPAKPEPMRSGHVRWERGHGTVVECDACHQKKPVAYWSQPGAFSHCLECAEHAGASATPAAKASPVACRYNVVGCKGGAGPKRCERCEYDWQTSDDEVASVQPPEPHRYRDGSRWKAPQDDFNHDNDDPVWIMWAGFSGNSKVAKLPGLRAPVAHAHMESRWATPAYQNVVTGIANDEGGA